MERSSAVTIFYRHHILDVQMTERWVADADPQDNWDLPIDGGYLCSDFISTYYIFNTDPARGIKLMRQKRLHKLRVI